MGAVWSQSHPFSERSVFFQKKVYEYGSTKYYERGCVSSCPTSQELLPASGLTLNQYCCGGSKCNAADRSAAPPALLSVLLLSAAAAFRL